jgi:hypothetical protein
MEVNYLLQCLGARKIVVNCVTGSFSKISEKIKSSREFEAGSKFMGASTEKCNEKENMDLTESSRRMETIQTFTPTKKPYIPSDLIYFHSDLTLQRLAKQRLSGNLTNSCIKISSKDLAVLSTSEINKICGEFKTLIHKGKADIYHEEVKDLKTRDTQEWLIDVEFVPTEQLSENHSEMKVEGNINGNEDAMKDEKLFYDMLKDCYEDGKVSEDERNLLTRWGKKMNISLARTNQMEEMVMLNQTFSQQETEYLEEVKYCMEDGTISDDERKMLNRFRQKLNIPEERASYLESTVKREKVASAG